MNIPQPHFNKIVAEFKFTTARSGGPGGQHVNKVNSKVVLRWKFEKSVFLTFDQQEQISKILQKYINNQNEVVLSVDESKSQIRNKEKVITKLEKLINSAFTFKKNRKKSKPSRASVLKRLDQKRKQSEKKQSRSKPD